MIMTAMNQLEDDPVNARWQERMAQSLITSRWCPTV